MSIYSIKAHFTKSLASAAFLAVAVLFSAPQMARAEMAPINDALAEMSIGSPDAPVTLNEYSSLTCGHCANFHVVTLPEIKKNYVDTGKVRIVFHDFPLDNLAFAAAMISRCAGSARHFELFDRLYHTQENWARSEDPRSALIAIARFSGLTAEDVDQCLTSEELTKGVQAASQADQALYNINATPTFVINGEKIEGAINYDDFKGVLDKALAAANAK